MSISLRFYLARPDFTLNVDLDIPSQGVTALFGDSGCGKTTLLRTIAGLERCPNGFLQIEDTIWQDNTHFVATEKRALGYVFQEASLFEHMNVMKNIQYGYSRVPEKERSITLEQAIELLDIEPLLYRKTSQLSGGERQRVAIARALASSPKILLMDEPLSALDLKRKREIMPFLESMHDSLSIPVIYVSHAAGEIARLADHLVLMEQGKNIASGALDTMLTRLDLPLAHGDKAATLIHAWVAEHDPDFAVTYLDFPGGRFTVAHKELPINHPVRLRVMARDVSITLERQTQTSILNIFPAIVDSISQEGKAQVMVRLLINGIPMLSRITRKSAAILDLKAGKKVYAQVKTVALLS